MHPNRIYRGVNRENNAALARRRAFGILTVNGSYAPLASHIPFLLSECGSRVEMHLVRSNPIVTQLLDEPRQATLIVSGGDTYISPDWYKLDDRVPTWNYVAVHISGELAIGSPEMLPGLLARLSENLEHRLLPKKPWTLDKLHESTMAKFTKMIMPVTMTVASIDGTWKLDQNKPAESRIAAAGDAVSANIGSEVAWLSDRMIESCDG